MRGETATDRSVFRITGEEARELPPESRDERCRGAEGRGLVYAALLSPQRQNIFADFFLVPHGDAVLPRRPRTDLFPPIFCAG